MLLCSITIYFSIHPPVCLQGAESNVAVPAISLSLLVQGTVSRGGLTGTDRIARRGIRVRHCHRRRCRHRRRRRRRRRYRRRCRRSGVHPHVTIQRHLFVGAVGAVRARVRFPHLELAAGLAAVVVLVVRRVLVHARPMGAVEGAMGLEGARRAESDAAWRADQSGRRRSSRFHRDRLLAVGRQDEQAT